MHLCGLRTGSGKPWLRHSDPCRYRLYLAFHETNHPRYNQIRHLVEGDDEPEAAPAAEEKPAEDAAPAAEEKPAEEAAPAEAAPAAEEAAKPAEEAAKPAE